MAQWNLDLTHSEAQFKEEFGLTWSAVTEAGGVVVGNDVKLLFSVQFAPAQA
ncbi:MAG: YceI family protein [Bacteroidetes bacterium]|nr:YceI family protein [Bacteroidota bacterium]